MKRTILSFMTIFFALFCGFAQQDDSLYKDKHGKVVLPQQGDFALGLSVNPLFNYVGNLFNGTGNNQLALKLLNNNQLFFKHFLAPDKAIRTKLGISIFEDQYLDNNIEGIIKESHQSLGLSIGYERRKDRERFQLLYGGEVGFDLTTMKYTYRYNTTSSNNRLLEAKNSNGIGLGIRGFVGVEYFVFPKVSIGSEMGISVQENFNKKSSQKYERRSVNSFENNSFEVNTDILSGQIYLLFHFN